MTIVRRSLIQLVISVCLVALGFVSDVSGQRFFRATLDGTQEVPPTATTASGTGYVILNTAETQISYRLEFTGLGSNQTAAHIHGPAARGVNAGVLFSIGSSGTTSGVFSAENIAVTAGQVADLKNGLFYFNVHSTGFPGGEIRGQIEPDCSQLPSGLVSWWRGEGNELDQNALNNGTIQGNVTYVGGRIGRTFRLGGNGNNSNFGDRVIVGNPANLQLQDFTIEAWVRRQSATITTNSPVSGVENGTIFAYGQNGYGLVILQSSGLPALTKIQVDQITSTGPAITDTNFHHLAITKSGNQVIFYVDGVASTPINYTSTFQFTSNAAIGARGDGDARNAFFGDVDDLAIFNRALSPAEIISIYNGGAAGKCPPCIAPPVGLADWWTGDGNLFGGRNRNNASFISGATFAEGFNGPGYIFGGAGNQTAEAPDSATLDVTTQFTLDAWINPAILHNGLGQGAVFSKIGGLAGNNGYQFGITNNNTQIFCQFNAMGEPWPTNQLIANVPAGGLPLNTWSHIACTYNNADLRIYLDGIQIGSLNVGPKTVVNSSAPLRISGDSNNNVYFTGRIDEPHIFDRALSGSEIASVVNAGRSCFCKPGATTAPSGQVGWWGGDGNPNDISGNNNNGTLQNGAGFGVSKVGQGFLLDGTNDYVSIPASASLDVGASPVGMAVESWINPSINDINPIIEWSTATYGANFWWGVGCPSYPCTPTVGGGNLLVNLVDTSNNSHFIGTQIPVTPINTWSHVAFTYNKVTGEAVIYVNGVSVQTQNLGIFTPRTNVQLNLGARPVPDPGCSGNGCHFAGMIDEASIYNRVLTQAEITSIFNAGLAGKLKQSTNSFALLPRETKAAKTEASFDPEGVGLVVTVGDATITFNGGSGSGTTQSIPLSLSGLPPFPNQSTGLTYDISTTLAYTGQPQVCFKLPSFTPAQFSNLRILHLENGSWVNQTNLSSIYDDLCTTALPSLSPFAIVNLAPSAANVSVSGRVLTANGQGVSRARVTMTDPDGVTRTAVTGSFGYYRFDEVEVGRTYVVSIGSKRYTFTPRVINVTDELTDLDFVAIE